MGSSIKIWMEGPPLPSDPARWEDTQAEVVPAHALCVAGYSSGLAHDTCRSVSKIWRRWFGPLLSHVEEELVRTRTLSISGRETGQ